MRTTLNYSFRTAIGIVVIVVVVVFCANIGDDLSKRKEVTKIANNSSIAILIVVQESKFITFMLIV